MTTQFYQGQMLKSVWWDSGQAGFQLGNESFDAKSIEVVMESGQMAGVPWAYIIRNNGTHHKVNLAMVESVELVR